MRVFDRPSARLLLAVLVVLSGTAGSVVVRDQPAGLPVGAATDHTGQAIVDASRVGGGHRAASRTTVAVPQPCVVDAPEDPAVAPPDSECAESTTSPVRTTCRGAPASSPTNGLPPCRAPPATVVAVS